MKKSIKLMVPVMVDAYLYEGEDEFTTGCVHTPSFETCNAELKMVLLQEAVRARFGDWVEMVGDDEKNGIKEVWIHDPSGAASYSLAYYTIKGGEIIWQEKPK